MLRSPLAAALYLASVVCNAQTCPAPAAGRVSVQRFDSTYATAEGGKMGSFRSGQPADLMLSGFGFNESGGPLQFRYPSGIAAGGGQMLLADRSNNRVLVWKAPPEANAPPDFVLGQPDFYANDSGSSLREMNWPMAVATDGERIVVADAYNDRLLIWNRFPTESGTPADLAVPVRWPWGVWTDGRRLAVSATGDRTVLVWNTFPTRPDQPPDLRLRAGGQIGTPRSITSNGKSMLVGDHNSGATALGQGAFVWKDWPASSESAPDYFLTDPIDEAAAWLQGAFLPDGRLALLGRTVHLWDNIPADPSQPPALSIRNFDFQGGDGSSMAVAGQRLYLSTANSNRVVVYDTPPTREDQPPDWALGASDLCTNTLTTNGIITNPVPTSNGRNLFVTSDFDRKLYVWRRLPDETGARADLVYTFEDAPWQHALLGDTLIVAGKRRLYIWRELPLDGQMPEILQAERIGSVRFQEIRGVAWDGRYLSISDMQAGKVYVWEGIPSADSEPVATLSLERPTRLSTDGTWLFVAETERQSIRVWRVGEWTAAPRTIGGPGRFNLPEHALVTAGRVFVADTVANRIHMWDRVEDALSGAPAQVVLGAGQQMRPATRRDGLFWPGALSFDGSYLWAGEFKFSGRLLRFSPQAAPASTWEALLEKARNANPQRYKFATDIGASIQPTTDGRSFSVLWMPPNATADTPIVVTLHGSTSWAFDEIALWHQQASAAGYGILALQWWFAEPDSPTAYYAPTDLQRELAAVLKSRNLPEGRALLHGFSRGSSNIYAVSAQDRQADRFYGMTIANAGGASVDFPPNVAITNGESGWNAFSGSYWFLFCGGQDPTPDRDGCPAMQRTADWIGKFGGVIDTFLADPAAGHGGFHQTPAHMKAALDSFAANLTLRRAAQPSRTTWTVRRDPNFEIPRAGIPNAGMVAGQVWLTVSQQRVFVSDDGSNASTPERLDLAPAFAGSGYVATEVVPREGPALFVLGMTPPGTNVRAAVYRVVWTPAGWGREPAAMAFEGPPEDGQFPGVPDVMDLGDGRMRLIYVARNASPQNSRTAISANGGRSFLPEFANPFGDAAIPNPRGTDLNVNPAVLRLKDGGYLGIGMRGARLYVFNSIDGKTFVPSGQPAIEPPNLFPGATGLFDPTLVQAPDGRIWMYVTAGVGPAEADSRVVRAELIPNR